ncbi:unnamed protein product [Medioppia subpectinata]|uniref:Uncharacterized protein n=1 Tax=Medioppia subpectinata TaxID=1979941 RepID=A0A7R9PTR0_9ACAR|nr:unnamed protein product [Medioppia subpectinata]CAG2100011.1 unnamed protein product [Medioppia subpectinata]
MNTYITSYLRMNGEKELTYSSAIWINTAFITGMGIIIASTAITYFSIQWSFLLVVITYGLMPALGSGLAYAAPLWFPNNKGIVTGITVGGFGLGALIFDQVQTLYLNPNNYSPKDDKSIYFLNKLILEKVPLTFLILSPIYGLIQAIGVALIFNADKHLVRIESNETIENIVDESQTHSDITPKDALKSPYGIDLQYDDHYLALVGSLASVYNAVGRIFWGKLFDKYNFKAVTGILGAIMLEIVMDRLGYVYSFMIVAFVSLIGKTN